MTPTARVIVLVGALAAAAGRTGAQTPPVPAPDTSPASPVPAESMPVAEDSLDAARALYEGAAYEDALAMLDRLSGAQPAAGGPGGGQRDLHVTRALCLLALDREAEARRAMEALVEHDPSFELDAAVASPRVREMLRHVRAERLPAIIRERYGSAKRAFDAKDYALAADGFDRVHRLLADPVLAGSGPDAGLDDLRTLVAGFLDLSRTLQPAPVEIASVLGKPLPAPPTAAGTPGAAATGRDARAARPGAGDNAAGAAGPGRPADPASARGPVTTATGGTVVAPVPLEQPAPLWPRTLRLAQGQPFTATVEVVLDQAGRVTSARVLQSVSRAHDEMLLEAIKRWRYKPATRGGLPIPFTKVVEITVEPPSAGRGD